MTDQQERLTEKIDEQQEIQDTIERAREAMGQELGEALQALAEQSPDRCATVVEEMLSGEQVQSIPSETVVSLLNTGITESNKLHHAMVRMTSTWDSPDPGQEGKQARKR